jgi:hypothetical protein
MNRREFISLLGGAAAAWPFAAREQHVVEPLRDALNLAAKLRRALGRERLAQFLGRSLDDIVRWDSPGERPALCSARAFCTNAGVNLVRMMAPFRNVTWPASKWRGYDQPGAHAFRPRTQVR